MKKYIIFIIALLTFITLQSCSNNKQTIQTNSNIGQSISEQTQEKKYNVAFYTNGGSPVENQNTSKILEQPLTAKDDYLFVGWYFDSSLTQKATFPLTITKNTNLYAKWERVKYDIYFDTNGGSSIKTIKTDNLKTAPQTPSKKDHLFDNWYLDKNCTIVAKFPIVPTENMTLYANWLKLKSSAYTTNQHVLSANIIYNDRISYDITPDGFDFYKLSKLNYNFRITVTYEIYYTKDYDALLDIGYFGAPKFDTYIKQNDSTASKITNKEATKAIKSYTITYETSAYDLIGKELSFDVVTENIQNKIYLQNITINYECYK